MALNSNSEVAAVGNSGSRFQSLIDRGKSNTCRCSCWFMAVYTSDKCTSLDRCWLGGFGSTSRCFVCRCCSEYHSSWSRKAGEIQVGEVTVYWLPVLPFCQNCKVLLKGVGISLVPDLSVDQAIVNKQPGIWSSALWEVIDVGKKQEPPQHDRTTNKDKECPSCTND